MTRVRVLIVDDHPIFRDGLRTALAGDDIEVVGEVAGGHEAVEVAATLQPDVVLMDLQMPHGTGIEATRIIAAAQPATAILS